LTLTLESLDGRVAYLEGQVKAVSHLGALAQGRYELCSEYMQFIQRDMTVLRAEFATRIGRVEERLDGLESRMDGLEVRMDGLEVRMDRLEVRMDRLEARVDEMDQRLVRVEERQIGQDAILKSHGEMLQEILRRLPPAA
jgi:phage shock protein A